MNRSRHSPAIAVASVALFAVLGGTDVAASGRVDTAQRTVAVPGAGARAATGVRPLGLPSGQSLLFALQADSGTLERRPNSRSRYVLTLHGTSRRTVWFTDRPLRGTGDVSTPSFLRAWGRLGFRGDPPNAVLSPPGNGTAEPVTIELGTPQYRAAGRTVRVPVRVLGRRPPHSPLPHRFGPASLFIDNANTNGGCGYTGEVDTYPASVTPDPYVVANGRLLQIAAHPELFHVLGTRFGGDGHQDFAVPNLPAANGLHALICDEGSAPVSGGFGGNGCVMANVQLFALRYTVQGYVPADGSLLQINQYPLLYSYMNTAFGGDGNSTFAVPNLRAPPGMSYQVCASGTPWNLDAMPASGSCTLTEIDLWATRIYPVNYIQVRGDFLPVAQWDALFSLILNDFGGDGYRYFALPNIAPPLAGMSNALCASGTYPQAP